MYFSLSMKDASSTLILFVSNMYKLLDNIMLVCRDEGTS